MMRLQRSFQKRYSFLKIVSLSVSISLTPLICHAAPSFVEGLLDKYEAIPSVSCSVRKTTKAGGQTVRMLSRVHYKSGGFIHVENVAPSKRRVIADGKNLYYHDSKMKRGFSRSIDKLEDEWKASLYNVPGSPMEHLVKMRDMKYSEAEKGPPQTRLYHGDKRHIRMTLDQEMRIISLKFYKDSEMTELYAEYRYSDFIKAGSVWLARRHEAEINLPDGSKAIETRLFDNIAVAKPIPPKLFDYRLFMADVEFVDDFEKTWSD